MTSARTLSKLYWGTTASALVATTLSTIEATIRLLHTLTDFPVVFVGGTVVTPDYARQMGVDYYAKAASASAEIVRKVL